MSYEIPSPNPESRITVFDFYCDSFEELPVKMEKQVGYKVLPQDVWSINVSPFEMKRLHVTLTIIYWKPRT
jgi:hypothetical protein